MTADEVKKERFRQFANWLKLKRIEAGMNQTEASRRANFKHSQQWSHYETGFPARQGTVVLLARAINADVEEALQVAGYSIINDPVKLQKRLPVSKEILYSVGISDEQIDTISWLMEMEIRLGFKLSEETCRALLRQKEEKEEDSHDNG